MARLVWIVAVLACSVAGGEEPDLKWVDAVASRARSQVPSKKELELDVRRASIVLKSAKSARIGNANLIERGPLDTNIFTQINGKNVKQQTIKKCQQDLEIAEKRLKDPSSLIAVPMLEQPRGGAAGSLWNNQLRVVQVISDKEAIVKISWITPVFEVRGQPAKASDPQFVTVWLETDTTGWSNDSTIDFTNPLLFTGTHEYKTVGGSSNTVLVARVWTDKEMQRFRDWKPDKTKQ